MTDPLQQYLAKLTERHTAVRNSWHAFLIEVGKGQPAGTKAATRLSTSLTELQALLTPETTPQWLNAMLKEARQLSQEKVYSNDQKRVNCIKNLWAAAAEMDAHEFNSLPSPELVPLVSVDQVVSQHFTDERRQELDELYDSAIRCVQDVVNSGKVDSIRVTQDLRRILATIEDARQSSFVSQRVQVSTLDRYLSAVAEATSQRIPGLKFLHDVVKKANSKLEATNNEILETLNRRADELSEEMRRIAERQPLLGQSDDESNQIPAIRTEDEQGAQQKSEAIEPGTGFN